jgi:hypothetical protein
MPLNQLKALCKRFKVNTTQTICTGAPTCLLDSARNGNATVDTLNFRQTSWNVHADCHRCAIAEMIAILEKGGGAIQVDGPEGGKRLGYQTGASTSYVDKLYIYRK